MTDETTTDATGAPLITSGATLVGKITSTLFLFQSLHNWYKQFKNWKRNRNAFTVAIGANDRFFYDVQKWLIAQISGSAQRNLLLVSREEENMTEILARVFDSDSSAQTLSIDGNTVWVEIVKPLTGPEALKAELSGTNSNRAGLEAPRLLFTTYSTGANNALLKRLDELKAEATKSRRRPRLHLLSSWYSNGSSELPNRSIDSIVLADGQMDRIVADMEKFLASEAEYARRGIPWHRGYLFHGAPGTGKSSLAKGLASHFGLDLYYYPIGAVSSDLELTKVVSGVSQKSILLLEDVDVFKGFKDRENDKESFSLSGFLNILDGVMTPHGLMTIMTTNHKEKLDPAVLRPGRVDLDEELYVLQGDQADRMFEVFYGSGPSEPLEVTGISPSVQMEIMKSHLYDPHIAEKKIIDLRGKVIEVTSKRPVLVPNEGVHVPAGELHQALLNGTALVDGS